MVLKIRKVNSSQWLDLLPLIEQGGLKRSREDIDGQNAGRVVLNADMIRDRKATKIRLDITCRKLTDAQVQPLLNIIEDEWVVVTYTDPRMGLREGIRFYSNNNPATCECIYPDGTALWGGITFPLIER